MCSLDRLIVKETPSLGWVCFKRRKLVVEMW